MFITTSALLCYNESVWKEWSLALNSWKLHEILFEQVEK